MWATGVTLFGKNLFSRPNLQNLLRPKMIATFGCTYKTINSM